MHGLRILVAEDNLLEAEWLQQLLADAGHEVIGPVARLGEALYLATHEQIDGALLNVDLAGVNSFAVAGCLRDRRGVRNPKARRLEGRLLRVRWLVSHAWHTAAIDGPIAGEERQCDRYSI